MNRIYLSTIPERWLEDEARDRVKEGLDPVGPVVVDTKPSRNPTDDEVRAALRVLLAEWDKRRDRRQTTPEDQAMSSLADRLDLPPDPLPYEGCVWEGEKAYSYLINYKVQWPDGTTTVAMYYHPPGSVSVPFGEFAATNQSGDMKLCHTLMRPEDVGHFAREAFKKLGGTIPEGV